VILLLIARGFWMKEEDMDCQNQIRQKILASIRAGDATIPKKLLPIIHFGLIYFDTSSASMI